MANGTKKLRVPEDFWRNNEANMREFKARETAYNARQVPEGELRENEKRMAEFKKYDDAYKRRKLKGRVKKKGAAGDGEGQ
jgi:hypothetical protein